MTKPESAAKPAVGLFAKPPRPGSVKTRLCPPLSLEDAALLYAAFLGDLAEMLDAGTLWEWLVYTPEPESQRALWPKDTPRPLEWRRQTEGDLGERMNAALCELLAEGRPSAVLVGSDHPTVTRDMIREAFKLLNTRDVVLGPTFDGGLYLVGLARAHPEIFIDVPWSTERVLGTVLSRATTHGVPIALVRPWYDVDDARDLEFLRSHVRGLELAGVPSRAYPRTRAVLARIS